MREATRNADEEWIKAFQLENNQQISTFLHYTSLFHQVALSWVWRCCSVFLSTDAVKNAARADSAPQQQFPSRRWNLVCRPQHPGAATAKEQGASVGARRSTSPPRPGCLSGTSWTATSTQWTPPTEKPAEELNGLSFPSCSCLEAAVQSWGACSWANASNITFRCDQQLLCGAAGCVLSSCSSSPTQNSSWLIRFNKGQRKTDWQRLGFQMSWDWTGWIYCQTDILTRWKTI